MSKKTSRILSLGLLMSSMVVLGLEIWSPDQFKTTQVKSSESLIENIVELENKVEELESENSRILNDLNRLTEGYSNTLTLSDITEIEAIQSQDNDEVTTSNDSDKTNAEEYTVTVKEGQPSSVVAEQLEDLGLIDDRYDFNDYLESNDLAKKVRPGNFVVSSDMNKEELAQAVIR